MKKHRETCGQGADMAQECTCPEDTFDLVEFSEKYPGLWNSRLRPGSDNPREVAFARQWSEENSHSSPILDTLLDAKSSVSCRRPSKSTHREEQIAATLMQWLGSNVGMSFLTQAIKRSPEIVRWLKSELSEYNADGTKMSNADIARRL